MQVAMDSQNSIQKVQDLMENLSFCEPDRSKCESGRFGHSQIMNPVITSFFERGKRCELALRQALSKFFSSSAQISNSDYKLQF